MNTDKRNFAGALGIYTIGGLFWAFLPFFVGLKVSTGGFSQTQAGALGSAYLIGFSVASMTALWWEGRFNWRRLAAAMAAVVIAALLLLARLDGFALSLTIVSVVGLMMGAFWTVAYRIFSGSANPERSFSIGIVVSYSALALVTFVIGEYVVEDFGLTGSGYVLGAVVLVLALSALLLPRGLESGGEAAGQGASRPSPPVALALLAILGTSFGFAAVWAFTERIGIDAGFNTSQVSPVIASNLLASAGGSVLATLLGMRVGRMLPLYIGMVAIVVSIVGLIAVDSFSTYAIAVAGLGLSIGFVMPYQMGYLAALDRDNRFVLLIAAAQGIGSAAGPFAGGAAADAGGYRLLVLVAAAAVAASMLAILISSKGAKSA